MDEVRLVPIETLPETEEGGFLIPDDTFFDSVVAINGVTFVVLYKPSGMGESCTCAPDPGLVGGEVKPAFPF